MKCKEGVRYVEIQMAGCDADEDVTDQEMREFQRKMYECCTAILKDYAENCVFDASADEKIYDVGFIFFQYIALHTSTARFSILSRITSIWPVSSFSK